jgi:tetratricopeptide (TPR) repeat protein
MMLNTNHFLKLCRGTLLLAVLGSISGCAGLPSESKKYTEYSELGDAEAQLTYNTAFPIASAKEGVLRGDAAVSKGDLDRALFEYIRALEKGGANAETLYKVGRVHLARKDPERARLAFLLCLKELPDHAGALVDMGKLQMRQKKYDEAKALLSQALETAPQSAEVFNALGVIEDMQHNQVIDDQLTIINPFNE